MRATRRFWGVAAASGFLAALGVLVERPVLLLGAAGIAAWLVARQYAFSRELQGSVAALAVDQTVEREHVTVEEPVPTTLSASLSRPSHLALQIEPSLPIAASAPSRSRRTIRLDPGQLDARTHFSISLPVAGAYELSPPTVTAVDGLFEEALPVGSAASLTVAPRGPRNVHVGSGADEVATAYGEHPAGRIGSGLDPAELRKYLPGDPANRIDWKATARLDEAVVRTFDAETDRQTALLVDHRAHMGTGPDGETKLDYLRVAVLAFVESAHRLDDPIGCYTVGDEGVTHRHPPASTRDQFVTVRSTLHDLRPTNPSDAHATRSPAGARAPASARSAAATLNGDSTAFAATLRPYFEDTRGYVDRFHGDPLFETARTSLLRLRGSLWTAIFTDDTRRAELRETVKLARRGDDHVLVFLAPAVLFEPGSLSDLDHAYDRYVDFEEFRRELARIPRVNAFEVGPGDRLAAVLEAGRDRRTRRTAAGGG